MSNTLKQQFDLTNKVAILTGASKGIGKSMAHILATYGCKVVVSSRKQESVNEVAAELKQQGLDAIAIACHVGDESQLKNLVEQTIATYGRVDILINNAATNPVFGPLSDMNETVFDKVMNVNVKACMLLSNLCFPYMKKQGGGSIINVASVEGLKPSPGMSLYSISKAALIMLSQSQAKEWGALGIRSNALCPGLVQTKFSAAIWQNDSILKNFVSQLPLGRMAQPDEITGLALFLASDASKFCTGGVYTVDGGHMVV